MAANIAIISVLGYISFMMWSTQQARTAKATIDTSAASPPPDRAGIQELGSQLRKKGSGPLVLVAMSPTCLACEQDVPAFKRLSKAAHGNSRFGVEFAVPLKGPEPTSLVDGISVDNSQVHRVRLPQFGIHSVPIIAVLDSTGTVSQIWTGLIDGSKESEIQRASEPR